MPPREFLKRRNALWQRLRALSAEDGVPDDPQFEPTLRELSELIGWERERVLAGLGLTELALAETATPQEQP